jgi:hypothetical protein
MAVLIGAFLSRIIAWRARFGALVLGGTLAAGVFFISFNTLSFERQDATKIAIDFARKENLFPLYMDRTSYAIASVYMHQDPRLGEVRKAQDYDFQEREMKLVNLKEVEGYGLLNRGFMDYSWNRYRMERVDFDVTSKEDTVFSVDNPGSSVAYFQARLLKGVSALIPVTFLREKIGSTAEELLRSSDAVILKLPLGGQGLGGQ